MLTIRDPWGAVLPERGFSPQLVNFNKFIRRPLAFEGDDNQPVGRSESLPIYYSRNESGSQRERNSFRESVSGTGGSYSRSDEHDVATARAIKTARYPVLYEKMKEPRAARKALKEWKKTGRSDILYLTGPNQNLIEGGNLNIDAQNSISSDQTPTGRPNSDGDTDAIRIIEPENGAGHVRLQPGSPTTSLGRAGPLILNTYQTTIPPQGMAFSKPFLKKRGKRCAKIRCTLGKSYPNFHLEADYQYVDRTETVVNGYSRNYMETRLAFAYIRTKENLWVVALEKIGYNDVFLENFLGEAEYKRLEEEAEEGGDEDSHGPGKSGRYIKGHGRAGVEPTGTEPIGVGALTVARKITLPEGDFDLGGVLLKVSSFYELLIIIPEKRKKLKMTGVGKHL